METLFPHVAGLDIHQASVVASVRLVRADAKPKTLTRTFPTFPQDLLKLRQWLQEQGVTHVAMEATGVYWIPVYEQLEGHFDLSVCNAFHIKKVPGRKTDVSDATWIAQCLSAGLLRKSFVPPEEVRRVRDLTRYRVSLVQSRTTLANQIQRGLELGGLKLANVASDVLGKSGRAILTALANGERDPNVMAELAKGALRKKRKELAAVLAVTLPETVHWVLGQQLLQLSEADAKLAAVDEKIADALSSKQEELALLCSLDGIEIVAASGILAEISFRPGEAFPTAGHLASWAGVCPGQNESAGKTKSSRIRRGNPYLKRLLVQVAWSASRMKKSPWSGLYRRLVVSRGKKRAIIALAHRILEVLYVVLKTKTPYQPREPKAIPEKARARAIRHHMHRLQELGVQVVLADKGVVSESPQIAVT